MIEWCNRQNGAVPFVLNLCRLPVVEFSLVLLEESGETNIVSRPAGLRALCSGWHGDMKPAPSTATALCSPVLPLSAFPLSSKLCRIRILLWVSECRSRTRPLLGSNRPPLVPKQPQKIHRNAQLPQTDTKQLQNNHNEMQKDQKVTQFDDKEMQNSCSNITGNLWRTS